MYLTAISWNVIIGVRKLCGFTSKRAIEPELSTATGSVMLTGSIPLGPLRTMTGAWGQFWNTGGSLSRGQEEMKRRINYFKREKPLNFYIVSNFEEIPMQK